VSRFRLFIPSLVALFYGASPLDLIPDLIPLLGLTDDAAVIVLAIVVTMKMVKAYREKRMQKQRIPLPPNHYRG
jgi:uncharacterized membrane protein YkvA (DUF1232 family)